MVESVSKRITSTNNNENGYHWKGFIRFKSVWQDSFCAVLIGNGKKVPDRVGKTVYTKDELPDVYIRFIENGYSFTHFCVKESNLVKNWRTGELLCMTNSFLESILIANSYSTGYELMRTIPVDIDVEFGS